jgi:hypothetical protein
MYEGREEGPISTEVMDKQIPIEEMPVAQPQEEAMPKKEEPQIQEEKEVDQEPKEKSSIRRRKQKKRVATYLSDILKEAEKNGIEINKITVSIQSLQKQINLAVVGHQQSIKQILSQLSHLQKQLAPIQKDIQRVRTASILATKTRVGKSDQTTITRPKSKIRKSVTSTRVKRDRRSKS